MSVTHFNLQPWEEGLKGVNPGVHDLTAAHVHVNVERRVTLSFIAQLSPEKRRQTGFHSGIRQLVVTKADQCGVWSHIRHLVTLDTISSFISYFWDFPLSMTATKSGLRCETPWCLQDFDLSPPKFHFSHTVALFRYGFVTILTLSSCDSECSHKQLGTSCSLPSHQKGCTILAGTRKRSPCRLPGHSACQPTGLFGC